ncbi:MAG: tetratricopeptide repeat protein [Persicimonas sp.]
MKKMSSRKRRSSLAAVAAVAAVILSVLMVAPVWAEDDGAPKINADKEFARANQLASAGAVTRSIPHYEKVLEAAPERYPQAYYNLAEVYRFKEMCDKAVLLYHAYGTVTDAEEERADAARGVEKCLEGEKSGKLGVEVSDPAATVFVDGYLISSGGDLEGIELLAGEYHVEVTRADHTPHAQTVEIEDGGREQLEIELEKKLFFGEAKVEVDQEGAKIKLEPLELDSPKAKSEASSRTSPMEEAQRLPTGKYLLEVTKSGFDRWIRHIRIERDEQTAVEVRLSRGLPEAIRSQ